MIDELKILLDQMKGFPNMTYWILGGFLFYKLVTYLSFSGSVVYIINMLCKTSLEWQHTPERVRLGRIVINGATEQEIQNFLRSIRSTSYIHHSDIVELSKAWTEYKAKQKPNG